MKKINIAVIMGGKTAEHDISLSSGGMVVNNLDRNKYRVLPVMLSPRGDWKIFRRPKGDAEWSPGKRNGGGKGFMPAGCALNKLLSMEIDCVFIAMHGPFGEDGTIQGLMEILDLPYTGSDVCASALAMDKIKAKEIYRSNNIPTPPYIALDADSWARDRNKAIAEISRRIGFPCVLKPARMGSSVGISICRSRAGLSRNLPASLKYGIHILAETFIQGRELTCAVLDTPGGKPPIALPPTEIIPKTRRYFDYTAKYTPGASLEITPARIGGALTAKVQKLAIRAHGALGCSGMSRTDMIEKDGRLYVLETNTIPGMTKVSLLPQAARAAGLSFPSLLDRIIAVALETHRRRQRHHRVR